MLPNSPANPFRNRQILRARAHRKPNDRASNRQLDETLTQIGIKHEFHQSDGAHAWPVWRRYLGEFVPLLFTAKR